MITVIPQQQNCYRYKGTTEIQMCSLMLHQDLQLPGFIGGHPNQAERAKAWDQELSCSPGSA